MLPHRLLYRVMVSGNSGNINLKGGGRQPTLQPLLQKGKHSSDRSSPGVLLVGGTPFQRTGSTSEHRIGARAKAIVSATSWGRSPRTFASHPGTIRGVSTGPDAGARGWPVSEKPDPSSEELAREGLSRGAWVSGTRSCWANMEPLTRPAPRPPWSCTVSLLVGSLGGTHICAGPGASCVPVHPCRALPRLGCRTPGSGWFLEMQTGPHEQLWISWTAWGWSLHSTGSAARDSSSAARLNTPGMWMARRDLRCFWLQRRMWRASCDMRRKRKPSCRLIYATSPCCPYGPERSCSEGPAQTPDTACPLYVAPQSMAEASVNTTACLDTCSRGTPYRRNEGSDHGLKVLRQAGVIWTQ